MKNRLIAAAVLCLAVVLVQIYTHTEPKREHDEGLDEIYDDIPHVDAQLRELNAGLVQIERNARAGQRRDSMPRYILARGSRYR